TWHSTLAAKISALKILGGPLLSNLQGEHQPNYWLQAVQLQDRAARDRLLEMAAARQIQMRPLWTPLHQQPPYWRAPTFGTLQHTQTLFDTVICLPSSPRCDYG
ncbi:MAG TPA: hypothetical protein EYP05_09040, partial [Piscirickettsiaceae bacterium]|nr:hypothetical protein [Piscirickettsiaceae bacterium]